MNITAATIVAPGQLELREYPEPIIDDDSFLLRVSAVGVCGSDRDLYNGGGKVPFPIIPGHEFMGVVAKMGRNCNQAMTVVGGTLKEGDFVTVAPGSRVCGRCFFCRTMPHRPALCGNRKVYGFMHSGEPPHLTGACSEYLLIHSQSWVYKLPPFLVDGLGALTEPLSVALRAVERACSPGVAYAGEGISVGTRGLVIGCGCIGQLVMAVLKTMGASLVVGMDLVSDRLVAAKRMGADHTVNCQELTIEQRKEAILELFDGVGPDVVFETAGSPNAFAEGLELVRRGGKLVEVGHYLSTGKVSIDPHVVCHKDVDILGSWAYPQAEFHKAIDLLQRNSFPYRDLISQKVNLSQTEMAISALGSANTYKVLVCP